MTGMSNFIGFVGAAAVIFSLLKSEKSLFRSMDARYSSDLLNRMSYLSFIETLSLETYKIWNIWFTITFNKQWTTL